MGNNPNSPNLSAILGILGLIIGAIIGGLFGYLNAKTGAQAQISAAQEAAHAQMTSAAVNVYGPIFATQTAEAKITPAMPSVTSVTPDKGETLTMEAIPRDIYVFAGDDNPDGGRGKFSLICDDENIPNYRMEYFLPEDKYGYAGMVFRFPKGYNLSAYKTVRFTIMFKAPGDQVDLYVKDISRNDNSIRIVNNGKDEMNLSYEFTNFPSINFNAVMEIGVFASTYFMKGSHDVWVKNIHFVK
ncbi:MAG: hypothetical protein JW730_08745 [Anaerolineales bacterium]|nr:hypothetical protein [Anaerolineales bacterium]